MENQFDIKFEYDQLNENQLYTGSFPHDDTQVALNIVLGALQIDYEVKDVNRVILNP